MPAFSIYAGSGTVLPLKRTIKNRINSPKGKDIQKGTPSAPGMVPTNNDTPPTVSAYGI